MQLTHDRPAGVTQVTGHGPGWLMVDGERHEGALELGNGYVRALGQVPATLADLPEERLAAAERARPALVLLGSGAAHANAPLALVARFAAAGIGVEAMATVAAARTFNLVAGEGREVVAFLLPPG